MIRLQPNMTDSESSGVTSAQLNCYLKNVCILDGPVAVSWLFNTAITFCNALFLWQYYTDMVAAIRTCKNFRCYGVFI